MILRAGLFAPLVPRALRLEAAREVGRTSDLALLLEMVEGLPEGVPYALRLWPEQHRAELFLHSGLEPFLDELLGLQAWRLAGAYAGLEPDRAGRLLDRHPPEDPALVLAERWEEYLELDLGHDLLRRALEQAQAEVRVRVLRLLPSSGRPELAQAARSADWLELPFEEWGPRLETLARHGQLLDLLPRLRPEQALFGVEQMIRSGWEPPPPLRAAWEHLQGSGLPEWRTLEAFMLAPRVLRRVQVPPGLALGPCGTRMAWNGMLAPLDEALDPVAEIPSLTDMRFSPNGEVLGGVGPGGVDLLVVSRLHRPTRLALAPGHRAFHLSPTRHATRGMDSVTLWPLEQTFRIPPEVTAFAALDPPGAVIATSTGALGLFWAPSRELRWAEGSHPGGVESLAVRPGRRRYVATAGPSGTQLWRVEELLIPKLRPVGPLGPPARQLAFWGDFLVADGRFYRLENGHRAAELPGRVEFLADLGEELAVGLEDGTLVFWDGQRAYPTPAVGRVEQCVRAPGGYWAVAGGLLLELKRESPVALAACTRELPAVMELRRFMRTFDVEVSDERLSELTDIELQ